MVPLGPGQSGSPPFRFSIFLVCFVVVLLLCCGGVGVSWPLLPRNKSSSRHLRFSTSDQCHPPSYLSRRAPPSGLHRFNHLYVQILLFVLLCPLVIARLMPADPLSEFDVPLLLLEGFTLAHQNIKKNQQWWPFEWEVLALRSDSSWHVFLPCAFNNTNMNGSFHHHNQKNELPSCASLIFAIHSTVERFSGYNEEQLWMVWYTSTSEEKKLTLRYKN